MHNASSCGQGDTYWKLNLCKLTLPMVSNQTASQPYVLLSSNRFNNVYNNTYFNKVAMFSARA